MRRSAYSLLEVVLALAILGGAIAVIGETTSQGFRNSKLARDLTYAQLLCESKLNEIKAGMEIPEAIDGALLENTFLEPGQPEWLYSIRVESTPQEGLLAVYVTVHQDLAARSRPASFTLVRWMMDPTWKETLEAAAEEAKSTSGSTSGSSSGTGTSSSGSSSGGSSTGATSGGTSGSSTSRTGGGR
jgi:type II secretory pathway pseudopilin PulG